VLLDIWMPDTDGVTLLKEWSTSGLLTMPVIMMSGHATIDTAVAATKIGAIPSWKNPSPCKSCSRPWSRAWRATSLRLSCL
jgi:two-component system, NtrC family, nitrogen regulation response regulator NtrX